MKAIPTAVKNNVIFLLKLGHSIRKISRKVGVSNATVCRIRKMCSNELTSHAQNGCSRDLSFLQEKNLVEGYVLEYGRMP